MARAASLVLLTHLVALSSLGPTAAGQAPAIGASEQAIIASVLEPTQLVAMVGDQPIFAGDLLPTVNQMVQEHVGKVPESELNKQRAVLMQQLLQRKIEIKLIYLDFLRTIPSDKLDTALENITKQVEQQFYREQVTELLDQLQVGSIMELDAKLRSLGSSIENQKNEFREQAITRSAVGQKIDQQPKITRDEMWDYYQEHSASYDIAARARWEQLTVLFDRFPDRDAADRAIVEMGNQVLRGAPFATVARKFSQGAAAADGGYHDWTSQGSLVSKVLDQAIFSLELNQLSRKLEDERGYHIVRVLERHEARRIGFPEAQAEIEATLREAKRKSQIREYLEKLRRTTHVWTIFDSLAKAGPRAAHQ
ncbi:MAG: hypothetical protein FJ276_11115 [Planctomycetes bacterium]|nr:hypothetical protein [Planctomycetota bacterium]